MKAKILLPDCTKRKCFDVYNCVKNLGYEVILADEKPLIRHKLIYAQQVYPLRKDCFAHFAKDLELIRKVFNESRIIFIPTEEDTTILFLKYIEEYHKKDLFFALPDRPTFELARNKRSISRLCTSNNIPCPREYSLADLREGFAKIIAKPSVGSGGIGHFYVSSQSELCVLDDLGDDYIFQEQLPNPRDVEGAFFLFNKGKFVSYYGHKRIRTYPVKAGVTVYSKISFNEEVKQAGIRLLEKLNWHGLAMVEFLFNSRTSHYEIIEVNPRLWGSFLLSEFANTGFLKNYIRLSLGQHPKSHVPRHDVAIRWLFPFELLNLISMNARMENFWNFDTGNTCYIGLTYSPLRRSLMFLFMSIFDFQKIKKFFCKSYDINMVVVFDFDKTLTYKDTLLGFFYICSQKNIVRIFKVCLYMLIMVGHKVRFISNDNLKRAGVALFLRGKSKEFLTIRGEEYSKTVELNKVYYNEFLKYSNPYVISASFSEYLSPLLSTANLICSEIEFCKGKARGLKLNCYGKTKSEILRKLRIEHVDKLYTDSISDLALAEISAEINLVREDVIIRCHDLQHFIEMARK